MTPVKFPEHNVVFAADQPEYQPLPAFKDVKLPSVPVVTCWELTEEEIQRVIETKQVWLSQLTFGQNLQPVFLTAKKEEMLAYEEVIPKPLPGDSIDGNESF